MKRRTLDLLFSLGGLILALLLGVAGMVFTDNANFAKTYVHDQMADEKIQFKAADKLTADEKKIDCLTTFAGQELLTGAQAECQAKLIKLHMSNMGKGTYGDKYTGHSYAELGADQGALRPAAAEANKALAAANEKVTVATATKDPNLAALQADATAAQTKADAVNKELADVSAQRETMFKGASLRTALLTAYGFSELGAKAQLAALVSFLAAGLLLLLSIFGFIHALVTPKSKGFAVPE